MTDCLVNARFRTQGVTGVQRVAVELSSRMKTCSGFITPAPFVRGPAGHAWEQFVLPLRSAGKLLWSPCNTGPVAAQNQVVTIHDTSVFDHPEWFAPNFVRLYHAIVPRLARRVRKIVTVSSFSRSRLIDNFDLDPAKIEVVFNGVGEDFHPHSISEITEALAPYQLEPYRYFIAVSTREPRKNQDLILRAWSAIAENCGTGFKLVLVGGHGSRAIFAGPANADHTGAVANVVTTGYVGQDQLPQLISGAAAMLYPSLYEGFGLPVLEAMACGTPAITTRLTSIPEVAGDAAIYVDPRDPADLAAQMQRLANEEHLREALSSLGLARADAFSWTDAAAKMDAVIRSCD
jgi:Glycosyltransferase